MAYCGGSISLPESLVDKLRGARSIAVLTGSGVSAESGVPTFREAQTGLWERYDPHELATPEAYQRDPKLVWEWYSWRRELVERAAPNPGHAALAELERNLIGGFVLITQNVDGLHRRAGSQHVLELHGNIMRSLCPIEEVIVEPSKDDDSIPPSCPGCGAFLRPDVVWFGEALPAGPLEEAFRAARGCDLFISAGTSGLVHPAASLPFEALRSGAVLVEINPNDTPLTRHADYALRGRAGEALPKLVAATFGEDRKESLGR
ncbi:MAG: NAD-dependent protein deacetylase of SIR2 family [uncultured Rubrobacteraceae bacterium]|uniref:NAD-dependent protein deacylase n=1 Tax=uncultured Rubrobacteraceae bacterium TaxID=349277 RepID=A0A6J4QRB5_9ACTN|nr:MAG: NAD-dependent protein deacetylase of SIR2 family [uncultured Rubrobacteraceae bacterium]